MASNFKKRDYQRSRVYEWERKNTHKTHGTIIHLRAVEGLVDEVSNLFDIVTPVVKDGRGRRSAAAACYHTKAYPGGAVKLPRWARTRPIILHEMAHIVHYNWCLKTGRTKLVCGDHVAMDVAHGPRFVDLMLFLRHIFLEEPRQRWYDNAQNAGVDVREGFGEAVLEDLTGLSV